MPVHDYQCKSCGATYTDVIKSVSDIDINPSIICDCGAVIEGPKPVGNFFRHKTWDPRYAKPVHTPWDPEDPGKNLKPELHGRTVG